MRKSHTSLLALGLVGLVTWPRADQGPDDLTAFLGNELGFQAGELERLTGGDPIARVLENRSEDRQITLAGAIRLGTSRQDFRRHFTNVSDLVQGSTTPEAGEFGSPPKLGDLYGLTLPMEDLESLERCRVGDCELKLAASAIERFQRKVNWSGRRADAEARTQFLEMLVEDARGYLKDGPAALPKYADKPEPLSVAAGLDTLLRQMPYLGRFAPEFAGHLAAFPRSRLRGADDELYWAKESFGLKPVITLNHASVYAPPSDPRRLLIATAQIYATHYFQSGLRLLVLVEDAAPEKEGPAATLLYVESWRFDGPLSGFQRRLLTVRLEQDLRQRLQGIKDELGRDARND